MTQTVSNALLKRLRESKPDPAWLEPEEHRSLLEPEKPVPLRAALMAALVITVLSLTVSGVARCTNTEVSEQRSDYLLIALSRSVPKT